MIDIHNSIQMPFREVLFLLMTKFEIEYGYPKQILFDFIITLMSNYCSDIMQVVYCMLIDFVLIYLTRGLSFQKSLSNIQINILEKYCTSSKYYC